MKFYGGNCRWSEIFLKISATQQEIVRNVGEFLGNYVPKQKHLFTFCDRIKVENNEWQLINQSDDLMNYKNFCAVTVRGVAYTFGNYFGNGEVFKFK